MEDKRMSSNVVAQARFLDKSMKFECTAGENYKINIDYTQQPGSDKATTSLELFLTSLCSCMAATLTAMLQKDGKKIDELVISAQGTRRQSHPKSFESIDVLVKVKSPDAEREYIEKALMAAHTKICPVSSMIKGNTEIVFELEIG
jgi:putative redox protein